MVLEHAQILVDSTLEDGEGNEPACRYADHLLPSHVGIHASQQVLQMPPRLFPGIAQDQLDFLRDQGCGLIQGYLYSKPMPLDDLIAATVSGASRREKPGRGEYFEKVSLALLPSLAFDRQHLDYIDRQLIGSFAILELKDGRYSLLRCDQSYRRFLEMTYQSDDIHPGFTLQQLSRQSDLDFRSAVERCVETKGWETLLVTDASDAPFYVNVLNIANDPIEDAHAILVVLRRVMNI